MKKSKPISFKTINKNKRLITENQQKEPVEKKPNLDMELMEDDNIQDK